MISIGLFAFRRFDRQFVLVGIMNLGTVFELAFQTGRTLAVLIGLVIAGPLVAVFLTVSG